MRLWNVIKRSRTTVSLNNNPAPVIMLVADARDLGGNAVDKTLSLSQGNKSRRCEVNLNANVTVEDNALPTVLQLEELW